MFPRSKTFDFNHSSKKVSLLYFLEWAHKSIPKGAEDVTLELAEDVCTDNIGNVSYFTTWLELAWEEPGENPIYVSQMLTYKKKLEKWKKMQ